MNLHNDDGMLNEAGQKIVDILDSKEFMSDLYEGLDKKTRDELGQFYTPAKICIQMIEMLKATEFSSKNILDPCCGSGNLLIACLIAGADSDKVFPKVDWTRSWTVEEILKDYGYTEGEIKEVMEDLKNFKGMDD